MKIKYRRTTGSRYEARRNRVMDAKAVRIATRRARYTFMATISALYRVEV